MLLSFDCTWLEHINVLIKCLSSCSATVSVCVVRESFKVTLLCTISILNWHVGLYFGEMMVASLCNDFYVMLLRINNDISYSIMATRYTEKFTIPRHINIACVKSSKYKGILACNSLPMEIANIAGARLGLSLETYLPDKSVLCWEILSGELSFVTAVPIGF